MHKADCDATWCSGILENFEDHYTILSYQRGKKAQSKKSCTKNWQNVRKKSFTAQANAFTHPAEKCCQEWPKICDLFWLFVLESNCSN